jgi:hypothetical protein
MKARPCGELSTARETTRPITPSSQPTPPATRRSPSSDRYRQTLQKATPRPSAQTRAASVNTLPRSASPGAKLPNLASAACCLRKRATSPASPPDVWISSVGAVRTRRVRGTGPVTVPEPTICLTTRGALTMSSDVYGFRHASPSALVKRRHPAASPDIDACGTGARPRSSDLSLGASDLDPQDSNTASRIPRCCDRAGVATIRGCCLISMVTRATGGGRAALMALQPASGRALTSSLRAPFR